MGKKIWIEVKVKDNCLWRLEGNVFTKKPSLTEMQTTVGGLIEYMPEVYLMPEIKEMIVNEEGLLIGLEYNDLANMQLQIGAPHVVGDVLMKVDEEFITSDFWLKGDEE
jgi:hypothetical protein